MNTEREITNFFNGRTFLVLLIVFLVASAAGAFVLWGVTPPEAFNGLLFPSLSQFVAEPMLSMGLNIAAIAMVAVVLILLNKTFGFVRSYTSLIASAFVLLEIGEPHVTVQLFGGTIMCLIVSLLIFIMYQSYGNRHSQRSIFTVFAIIVTCSLFQYAYLYLLPLFFIGFILMRVMNFKGFLAMLIGIVTPLWITFGFGLADINSWRTPVYANVFQQFEFAEIGVLMAIFIMELILAIVLTVSNFAKIINYKTQYRAFNGFFVMLLIATAIMMCIDYHDTFFYLPIVNMCLAVQIAHAYTIHHFERRYVGMIVLIVAVVVSYAAQLAM